MFAAPELPERLLENDLASCFGGRRRLGEVAQVDGEPVQLIGGDLVLHAPFDGLRILRRVVGEENSAVVLDPEVACIGTPDHGEFCQL